MKKIKGTPTINKIDKIPNVIPNSEIPNANKVEIITNPTNISHPEYLLNNRLVLRYLPSDFLDRLFEGSIFNEKFSKDYNNIL
jgi:hypothetical protein